MNSLKNKLEFHYKQFDISQIYPDPLIFPHRFKTNKDIELSAFISSIFAYGNVLQIVKSLEKVHELFEGAPYEFIKNFNKEEHILFLKKFKHRFYSGEDLSNLLTTLRLLIDQYGSLENLFMMNYSLNHKNIMSSLSSFSKILIKKVNEFTSITNGVKFMFPDPQKGSACKRMNLFLRWMVRKDELDFGLWQNIRTNQLVIPVDTHVGKICTELGLTTRKTYDWKMAEEITENLKKFDAEDPVKYDFAICHIGMRKIGF